MDEEAKLMEELLKYTKIELGEGILKNQIETVYAEIKENLTKDNIKPAHYFESLKLSEEEYKDKHVKPVAIKRLQGQLILGKLAEIEKFEISEDEMQKEIDIILKRFSSVDVLDKLKALYIPGSKYYEELKQRITYRKLIDSFFTEETKQK